MSRLRLSPHDCDVTPNWAFCSVAFVRLLGMGNKQGIPQNIQMTCDVLFQVHPVDWPLPDLSESASPAQQRECLTTIGDYLTKKAVDFVINLPMRTGGARRVSSFLTHGYRTRRMAIEHAIPLFTDVKCAKLLVEVSFIINHVLYNYIDPLPKFVLL